MVLDVRMGLVLCLNLGLVFDMVPSLVVGPSFKPVSKPGLRAHSRPDSRPGSKKGQNLFKNLID